MSTASRFGERQHAMAAWHHAWEALAIAEPAGALRSLTDRYSEPHRAYHNFRHIEECFTALATASHLADRLAEVELALWFHDAVYDPRATSNERSSADLARSILVSAGLDPDSIDRIEEMIMATRHDGPVEDRDARLVADVDLWILASPPARFQEYQAQIREEYSWMPGDEFRRRRAEILNGFLENSPIYQTEWFRVRMETAARRNVTRELAALE